MLHMASRTMWSTVVVGVLAIPFMALSESVDDSSAKQDANVSGGVGKPLTIESLVATALSSDPSKSAHAAETLRARGPAALDVLFAMRDRLFPRDKDRLSRGHILRSIEKNIPQNREHSTTGKSAPNTFQQQQRIDAVIDQVGGQRYCSLSRLYWHTDFKRAETAARASGKPILSLRLLGKLTDELSCANSRYFRTTLYANQEIAEYLRTHFVLHWKSVRPVPVVTVDFGDGRQIKRTLTGNSIHYVLATDGAPIDALPGLYAPATFLESLQRAEQIALLAMDSSGDQRQTMLREYHHQRLEVIAADWQRDLNRVQSNLADSQTAESVEPNATAAAKLRILDGATQESTWKEIAALHHAETQLDASTVEVMRRENPPTAAQAMRMAVSKSVIEDPILQMIRRFRADLALDTVRNEYLLHSRLHQWFVKGEHTTDVDVLNTQVYAQVFLTPSSDPWIGLVKPSEYTALVKSGVISERQPARR